MRGIGLATQAFPNWVSKWPHKWIVVLCFVGFFLWYVLNVTILAGNAAFYRFGYAELLFLMLLEVSLAGEQVRAERVSMGGTVK